MSSGAALWVNEGVGVGEALVVALGVPVMVGVADGAMVVSEGCVAVWRIVGTTLDVAVCIGVGLGLGVGVSVRGVRLAASSVKPVDSDSIV